MLAEAALASYDLNDPVLQFDCAVTNLHYRVTTRGGQRFQMRLGHPAWRTLNDLQSEALWLDALAKDTDVGSPQAIRTREGCHVFAFRNLSVPEARHISLMTWVPGRMLGRHLSERNIERMGVLFGKLHLHGKAWRPPQGFTSRRFDHWLSRGEPNLLLHEATLRELSAPSREMLLRMHNRVECAYALVDPSDLRVIHCDLWHDNIKLHHDRVHPLDFEDTINGYRSHDIAMAMLDLLEATDDETYAKLLGAFRRGYENVLRWPDDPIESFQIGRLLWKMNHVARFHRTRLVPVIEQHMSVLSVYERTGRLVKPPAA